MKKISAIILLLLCIAVSGCERKSPNQLGQNIPKNVSTQTRTAHCKTVSGKSSRVRMNKQAGVYTVPISINGVPMTFIFDSGASEIVISNVEALFLYKQGKLQEEDFIGEQYYQIADGSIAVGTIINLKEVQIANKILYNVRATVVDNIDAPLLLGQTALSRFGKISIDYTNNIIDFE